MQCKATTLKGTKCSRNACEKGMCSQHRKMRGSISLLKVVKASDGKHKYTAIFDVNGKEKHTSFGIQVLELKDMAILLSFLKKKEKKVDYITETFIYKDILKI